jgi:hypothetical protein
MLVRGAFHAEWDTHPRVHASLVEGAVIIVIAPTEIVQTAALTNITRVLLLHHILITASSSTMKASGICHGHGQKGEEETNGFNHIHGAQLSFVYVFVTVFL